MTEGEGARASASRQNRSDGRTSYASAGPATSTTPRWARPWRAFAAELADVRLALGEAHEDGTRRRGCVGGSAARRSRERLLPGGADDRSRGAANQRSK